MRSAPSAAVLGLLCLLVVPLEAVAQADVVRVGTGVAAVRTVSGAMYTPDAGFVGGYRVDHPQVIDVRGTQDDRLYRSERWGMRRFSAPVPANGTYEVTLHMAEFTFEKPGERVFDVRAEDVLALASVDIVAAVGPRTAFDPSFHVDVDDGLLDLTFTSTANHAKVSAVTARRLPRPRGEPDMVGLLAEPAGLRSGAGGLGVADGSFGAWRGRQVDVAATWADSDLASTELWQLRPEGEYGDWTGDLDIAVGAFDRGGSWAAAARGAYDVRWKRSLQALEARWRGRTGTVHIRLAHESNGDWYPWRVTYANRTDFIDGWRRYRALQQQVFPAARLVFSVNRESVASGLDWRSTFPGAGQVDVMGVDYYNHYPYVDTAEEFEAAALEYDTFGAPKGLRRHLEFAESVGLPLAISEWSGNADMGDSPAFVQSMYDFTREHAGTGRGKIVYECLFNVDRDQRNWHLSGNTRMPASAEAYRLAW